MSRKPIAHALYMRWWRNCRAEAAGTTRKKPWTPAELELLEREYPDTDARALAARLGRSRQAIKDAASRLGIRKSGEHAAQMAELQAVQRLVGALYREIEQRA